MIFRQMNFDDAAEVRRVAHIFDCVPKAWNPEHRPDPVMVESFAKTLEEKRANFWSEIGIEGGEIRASHILEFKPERGGFVLIKTLWVHPEFRGQGIGRQLKAAGEEWARSRGAKAMVTQVSVKNRRMNAINEAMGFVPTKIEYEKKL